MKRNTMAASIFVALLAFTATGRAADSPYAGQESRVIKALSEQEISDYVNGRGMGTSKAAELNHYPGPKHVLDEAAKLDLSAEQIARTKEIHAAMAGNAARLGKEIVQKEVELEALYANRQATVENTGRIVKELAALQSDFRMTHLNAHLAMQKILSPQQIAMYDRLRGYGGSQSHGAGHAHH